MKKTQELVSTYTSKIVFVLWNMIYRVWDVNQFDIQRLMWPAWRSNEEFHGLHSQIIHKACHCEMSHNQKSCFSWCSEFALHAVCRRNISLSLVTKKHHGAYFINTWPPFTRRHFKCIFLNENKFRLRFHIGHVKLWGVITHPCPNFNGGLAKPPLKLGHGWVITPHRKLPIL